MSPTQMKNSIAKQATLFKILEGIVELGRKCQKSKADTHSLSQFKFKIRTVDQIASDINSLVDKVQDMKSLEDEDYEPDYSTLEKCIELTSRIKFLEDTIGCGLLLPVDCSGSLQFLVFTRGVLPR